MHDLHETSFFFPEPDYNFALQKPTAQSDILQARLGPLLSHYAVDGIKATSCEGTGVPACAHLYSTENQWWRVSTLYKSLSHIVEDVMLELRVFARRC